MQESFIIRNLNKPNLGNDSDINLKQQVRLESIMLLLEASDRFFGVAKNSERKS